MVAWVIPESRSVALAWDDTSTGTRFEPAPKAGFDESRGQLVVYNWQLQSPIVGRF